MLNGVKMNDWANIVIDSKYFDLNRWNYEWPIWRIPAHHQSLGSIEITRQVMLDADADEYRAVWTRPDGRRDYIIFYCINFNTFIRFYQEHCSVKCSCGEDSVPKFKRGLHSTWCKKWSE